MQKIILKFPETGGGERKRARGRPLKSTLSVRSEGEVALRPLRCLFSELDFSLQVLGSCLNFSFLWIWVVFWWYIARG